MNSSNPTILLIEDNKADIDLLKESLGYLQFSLNLNVITNGNRITDFMENSGLFRNAEKPDLIILDINLPGKNGFEVLSEIRKNYTPEEMPVIILTSSRQEKDIALAVNLKANAVLSKPSGFWEFNSLIKHVIEQYLKFNSN